MRFNDNYFKFEGDFGEGYIQSTCVKELQKIINDKKITKTEITTVDNNGKKNTVKKEEIGDRQDREYLLKEKG